MSLLSEKLRSIFKMREVLTAIGWSEKCNLPQAWRNEIRWAVKHCPFPSDKITIGKESFSSAETMSIDELADYIELVDSKCVARKRGKK